jgi:hypothetical protein
MLIAMGFIVALLASTATACSGDSGIADEAEATIPVQPVVDVAGGEVDNLVELHGALAPGHEVRWYTERLAELGYRIDRVRTAKDAVAYRIARQTDLFDVRITLREGGDRAHGVEIERWKGSDDVEVVEQESVPASTPGDPVASDGREIREPAPPVAEERRETRRAPERIDQEPLEANGSHEKAVDESDAPAVESSAGLPRTPAPGVEVFPAQPPEPRRYLVTVPAGTRVATTLDRRISSADAEVGHAFSMTVIESIRADGFEVLPAGARVWGRVAEVERAGRPNKGGRVVLVADAAQVGADELALEGVVAAEAESLEGRDSTHEDIKEVAIGAGLGGLVGGLLGGKKGVLVGVLVGGGGTFVATKGEEIELAAGTPLYVELTRDLQVTFTGPQ